jgi:hypothetical protein
MTEDRTDYTIHPRAEEPCTISDLRDQVAQMEVELEHAYAANDSVCEIVVAALERWELQMLRREHDAVAANLNDVDSIGHCPACFGLVMSVGGEFTVSHRDDSPYEAVEAFRERHG